MARYFGKIGFGFSEETPGTGKWVERIEERSVKGDILKSTRNADASSSVNPSITLSNTLSIVSNPYAMANYQAIRYAEFEGKRWVVTSVEVQRPRLTLTLGEVYNGPTPS